MGAPGMQPSCPFYGPCSRSPAVPSAPQLTCLPWFMCVETGGGGILNLGVERDEESAG